MSEQTNRLVDAIRDRLHATIRRITLAEVAYGALLLAGLVAASWFLLTGLETQFWLGTTARSVLIGALAVGALALAVTFIARPLLRAAGYWGRLTETDVARRIGARYPDVSDRLLNLLDLVDGRRTDAPSSLVDQAALRLGQDVEDVPFENVEDFRGVRQAGRWAIVPVVLLLGFLGLAPSAFLDASGRLLAPATTFERPAPFRFEVQPGAARLVKGDSLRITARAVGGEAPDAVTLATRRTGEERIERTGLTSDSSGRVRHTIVNVRNAFEYRISAGSVTSRWYEVQLTERPLLENLRVRLDYPDYTRMPDRRLDANVGDVKALPGTDVHLKTRIGGAAPDTAFVAFGSGETRPLRLDSSSHAASGQFTLERTGSYKIRLRGANGVSNRAPITYRKQLLADESPSISMVKPAASAELDESLEQGLRVRMADDFGFSALRLYWRRARSKQAEPMEEFKRLRLPLRSPRQLDQEVGHLWKLAPATGLDIQPGDVIEYYVKVWDNNTVAGYQSARTETHRLRYPSRSEQYEQIDEQQSGVKESMQDALQKSQQLDEELGQLRKEMRRKRGADWSDKRKLEQLQKKQQSAEQKMKQAEQKMERMTNEMKRNSLSDEQTMKMYEELQRAMDEVNAPEMKKAMKQLRKAMKNTNMKQMQKSLQNTQKSQQQYRRRLKRALSLLEKVKMRQQLDEVARRTQQLAEQEKRLAEQTEKRSNEEAEKGRKNEGKKEGEKEGKRKDEKANGQKEDGEQGRKNEGKKGREKGENQKGEKGQKNDGKRRKSEGKKGGKNAKKKEGSKRKDVEPQRAASQNDQQKSGKKGKKSQGQKNSGRQKSGKQKSSKQQSGAKKKSSQNEDLARKQDAARKEMKKLRKKMQEMQKKMQSSQGAPKKQMKQQMQQSKRMPQRMKQNSRQLRQSQMQKAQQGQKKMQKQLQQMSRQMQQMKKKMQGRQRQINIAGLRKALSNVLTLSRQQEGLRMGVRGLSSGDAQLRPYARRQRKLTEGLRTVSDTLQHLANNIPKMRRGIQEEAGAALDEMNAAVKQMSDRHAGRAAGRQKASMMHLNELALMLSDLLTNMQQQSGGKGGGMSSQQMRKKLRQMAGQQQKLNKQIQQMLNKAQGERLSPDKQGRLRQMARQQEALQRKLEKMSRNRNVRGKALGDLQKIAEDMEKTVEEMRERGASRRTVKRQRRIHTRLLNAQRSLNKRGTKKERKGKTGDDVRRESPDGLTPQEQAEKLRRDLIRALEKGYAPDYEQLIKRYFELLRKSSEK
jgi:hypothetical protein